MYRNARIKKYLASECKTRNIHMLSFKKLNQLEKLQNQI